jgi:predicted phosphodiesterase
MRLAVFSDIHGNRIALEAMLKDLNSVGEVDLIWCLGDLATSGSRPAECIQQLQALQEDYGKDKFKMIGGNADRYLITGERMATPPAKDEDGLKRRVVARRVQDNVLNWNLAQLSFAEYEFMSKLIGRELHHTVEGYGNIIGVHAVPGSDEPLAFRHDAPPEEALDALLDRSGRLALAGHTHHRMDRDLGKWRIINPGSVGLSFTQSGMAEWALLTFEGTHLTVDLRAVPYAIEAVIADAAANGFPEVEWLQNRLMNTQ